MNYEKYLIPTNLMQKKNRKKIQTMFFFLV